MPLTLSSTDLSTLTRTSSMLLSPFEFEGVDAWRSAVNRELRVLLNADSVGFLLPESGSLFLYSDEHDPAALARYPDLMPPSLRDGRSIFEAMAQGGVNTLERTYGADFDRYVASEYYNDYAGANGAHDTLAAMLPLHEAGPAGVQLWHAQPTGRKFGQREVDMLALLYPSIRAGILTHLRIGRHAQQLLRVIDELDEALLVLDASGAVVHESRRLTSLLAGDAERETVRRAASLAAVAPDRAEIETAMGRYTFRVSRYDTLGNRPLVLVAVEGDARVDRQREERVMESCGLTSAERKVARHLAEGRSNKEIASLLSISPHTARHHTESVLMKLGVSRRDRVAGRLRGDAAPD